MPLEPDTRARCGWESNFPIFSDVSPRVIRSRLVDFLPDASAEQIRAWDNTIPSLQSEVREVLGTYGPAAREYTAILEYELPYESRRPDVVLLISGAVAVLELKGKFAPSQADLDQASAYARDLRCYHRDCANYAVHAVVVPTSARGYVGLRSGVHVCGPDGLDGLIERFQPPRLGPAVDPRRFLAADAYCPLPTLVQAARELFESGTIRPIHRARAATDPAVEEISRIVHEAAQTRTRHLVLVSGVPGSGKTLVGLRVVHARFLDDLAVVRPTGKPSSPAVFLSGNGPLVTVLQYELRGAGGGGKTFVRGVKDYVKHYNRGAHLIPPEHVLVFDEAQRAWDRDQVNEKHPDAVAKSEPEHFIEFAQRIPGWCVIVGLIGTGQTIHVGEEGGLVQWRHAIEESNAPSDWIVHGPNEVSAVFRGSGITFHEGAALGLDHGIRYHLALNLHRFVDNLLEAGCGPAENRLLAESLENDTYHLRIARDLEAAKEYLRERYREDDAARYGLIASSRDKSLPQFGVDNDFNSTKVVALGRWYAGECRYFERTVTEFGAQGLELDAALLAWGTDLMRRDASWTIERARRFKAGTRVRDPYQLRLNAYRVLLTRGRDATLVFVPPLTDLDETYEFLLASGFRAL